MYGKNWIGENSMDPSSQGRPSGERTQMTTGALDRDKPVSKRGTPGGHVLSDELLARLASRAATYDRENRFFDEDFDELRAAKYLLLPVPRELDRKSTR